MRRHFLIFINKAASWHEGSTYLQIYFITKARFHLLNLAMLAVCWYSDCAMSSLQESNPLLEIQFRIAFDRIRAEHVEPAIAELLRDARAKLEALAADAEPRTFENTMLAYEAITERLEYAMGIVRHLESVATYPEIRAALNAVQPSVSAFESSILLHEGLWKTVQRYARMEEAQNLTGTRLRFLKKTMDD